MSLPIYVEAGVGGHIDGATQAWLFALEHWGRCGQGHDEPSAVEALCRALQLSPAEVEVAERIRGDEQAFARDHRPATPDEVAATRAVLVAARAETMALIAGTEPDELDWDDPERRLPAWARWRTLRQMGWHLADTESRYYLGRLGVDPPTRADDLLDELRRSHDHVLATLTRLPPTLAMERVGEQWTTVKVLRRLAWHERAELQVMRQLRAKARRTLSSPAGSP